MHGLGQIKISAFRGNSLTGLKILDKLGRHIYFFHYFFSEKIHFYAL